jgi:preprotein translocase subunit SecG
VGSAAGAGVAAGAQAVSSMVTTNKQLSKVHVILRVIFFSLSG